MDQKKRQTPLNRRTYDVHVRRALSSNTFFAFRGKKTSFIKIKTTANIKSIESPQLHPPLRFISMNSAKSTPSQPITDTFLFIYSEQSHAGRIFTYANWPPVKFSRFLFIPVETGRVPQGVVGAILTCCGGGSRAVGGRGWPLPALD